MARNSKKLSSSFRTFLQTGKVGPIHNGMSMGEIADLLGPPEWWLDSEEGSVPLYWGYGRFEIQFDPASPHKIDWFQFEQPSSYKSRHRHSRLLSLSMDGIELALPPSALLQQSFWSADLLEVAICDDQDDPRLQILNGPVALIYICDVGENDILNDRENIRTATDLVSAIDRHAVIDSIYSFRFPAKESLWPKENWTIFKASAYLAMISEKG